MNENRAARVTRAETVICALTVVAGLVLRFTALKSAPAALASDEGRYLQQAHALVSNGEFRFLAKILPYEELLSAYFYDLIDAWTGCVRLGPALVGTAEVLLAFLFVDRAWGRRAAWLATAFLAVCPWHLYYSRIAGPIMGLVACVFLFRLAVGSVRPIAKTVSATAFGLLYYSTFKLALAYEALLALLRRDRRIVLAIAAGTAIALAVLMVTGDGVSHFLFRGGYNFEREFKPIRDYGAYLLMPFWPGLAGAPFPRADGGRQFIDVSLYKALGFSPLLGWPLAALACTGLGVSLARMRSGKRDRELGFLLLCFVTLGSLGPSPIHNLVLIPSLLVLAVRGFEALGSVPEKARTALLAVALAASALTCWNVLARLEQPEIARYGFEIGQQEVADRFCALKASNPGATYFYVPIQDIRTAERMGANSGCFEVIPPLSPPDAIGAILEGRNGAVFVAFQRVQPDFDLDYVKPRQPEIISMVSAMEEFVAKLSPGSSPQAIRSRDGYELAGLRSVR